MVECNCGKRYVGETKLKVKSRISQHQKTVTDEKWEASGIPLHAENCKAGFKWEDTKILKTSERRFDRKVRQALEIQLQDTTPCSKHSNILDSLEQNLHLVFISHFVKRSFTLLRTYHCSLISVWCGTTTAVFLLVSE